MNNIKRNKKIIQYLKKELNRIGYTQNLEQLYEEYIVPALNTVDTNFYLNSFSEEEPPQEILDNDQILIETLKIIGIMEVSEDEKDFKENIDKKQKIRNKNSKQKITDFDKVLKGIMQVPKPKEDKK